MKNTCEAESRPKGIREFVKSGRFWKSAVAMVVGGVIGYLYYHYAGESMGTSTFTRTPVVSILSGAFLGIFFVNRPCSSC